VVALLIFSRTCTSRATSRSPYPPPPAQAPNLSDFLGDSDRTIPCNDPICMRVPARPLPVYPSPSLPTHLFFSHTAHVAAHGAHRAGHALEPSRPSDLLVTERLPLLEFRLAALAGACPHVVGSFNKRPTFSFRRSVFDRMINTTLDLSDYPSPSPSAP